MLFMVIVFDVFFYLCLRLNALHTDWFALREANLDSCPGGILD